MIFESNMYNWVIIIRWKMAFSTWMALGWSRDFIKYSSKDQVIKFLLRFWVNLVCVCYLRNVPSCLILTTKKADSQYISFFVIVYIKAVEIQRHRSLNFAYSHTIFSFIYLTHLVASGFLMFSCGIKRDRRHGMG